MSQSPGLLYPSAADLQITRPAALRYTGPIPPADLKRLIERCASGAANPHTFYVTARDQLRILDRPEEVKEAALNAGLEWADLQVNYELHRCLLKREWSMRVCGVEFERRHVREVMNVCYDKQRVCNEYTQSRRCDSPEAVMVGIQMLIDAVHDIRRIADAEFVLQPGFQRGAPYPRPRQ